jgi:hypothetical protein
MPVLGRSMSLAPADSGEVISVIAENLYYPLTAFRLYGSAAPTPFIQVHRITGNQEKNKNQCYGAGCRVLLLTKTCEGRPTGIFTPVVVLGPGADQGEMPLAASLLEGAVDPVISIDATTGEYHLLYWVNAWSPPLPESATEEQLRDIDIESFPGTAPPQAETVDETYRTGNSKQPPKGMFSLIRDLPYWPLVGSEPPGTETPTDIDLNDKVGPFDISRFWVAPFSDAHLYRFSSDVDTAPPPTPYRVEVTDPATGEPVAPFIPTGPEGFIENYTSLSRPDTKITQATKSALLAEKDKKPMKPTEKATLEEYRKALVRLHNLARTTRVLMYTKGKVVAAYKQADPDIVENPGGSYKEPPLPREQSLPYLVVDQPRPMLYQTKAANKVITTRQKLTSFLRNGQIFVTAPFNYSYPSAGTVSLCIGQPQVDFTIGDPNSFLIDYYRSGTFPIATRSVSPPFQPQVEYRLPFGPGFDLAQLLTDVQSWSSF